MNPNNLKYSKNHEWVGIINIHKIDDNKKIEAYVGVSLFAQKELGDIIFIDIEKSIVKKNMKEGEIFGTIEAVKTVSDLFIPISCTILDINKKTLSNPELINKNPYENWIIKIQIKNIDEYNTLMSLIEYEKYLKI
ncbi:glycine cleavage system protein H [Blattabacterium cuenoti]|uniref:glycine cleavage system protein H n=1 Tax=Blattabacterium cuenoti TaxID=1653831 RepID=UPI00163C4079|nr:glycine cleavage system protein H [Blattabacterium cuenoti]